MSKGKGLFPPRHGEKGETGRTDCNACSDNTIGKAIALFFDPKRLAGERVIRLHLDCLRANPALVTELTADWEEKEL